MSYKDKQKLKEAQAEASRRYRQKHKDMTQGMTADKDMTQPNNHILVLSDGQILDRSIQVEWHVPAGWSDISWSKAMTACNRDNFVPSHSLSDAERQALHIMYDSSHHPDGRYREPTIDDINQS